MHYDEQHFKKNTNKQAMLMWLILGIILSLAYANDVRIGKRTIEYYLIFASLCWIPFIFGLVILKVKGMAVGSYKRIAAVGYGVFYSFILLTTSSPLTFVYLLPLTSILIIYKDRNYIVRCALTNMIVLVIYIVLHISKGQNSPDDMVSYAIQFGCLLLCYTGYIISINHLTASDGALLASLQKTLDKVVHTVETVKTASNDIVDGMSAVREMADDNIVGSNTVVNGMSDLTKNNSELQQNTTSSLNLTETINTQVLNVASMIGQMVDLTSESTKHAKGSSEELSEVLNLSIEVEEVLREFKNQFKTMTDEVNLIESITMQTNILSLNASVEAARTGAAGKGFAVVAGEIKELSNKTKISSDSIFAALQHLEETSNKMTESITKTLSKVKQVNQSVEKITTDTTQMGENIKIIDTSITEVKSSNIQLVNNMHEISNVVDLMTSSITTSKEITKDMLEKSIDTTKNIAEVETIVGTLMEELGVIGVMGIKDIQVGQSAKVKVNGNDYSVKIKDILQDGVDIKFSQDCNINQTISCNFVVTVDNAYYKWDSVELSPTDTKDKTIYKVTLTSAPHIVNRRKYTRVPLHKTAHLTILETNYTCDGEMVNISAGGYAFKTTDTHVLNSKNQTVSIVIDDWMKFKKHELDAKVIRVSGEAGHSNIGCRFLQDVKSLRDL